MIGFVWNTVTAQTRFCHLHKHVERKPLRIIGENEERKTGKVIHKKEGKQGN